MNGPADALFRVSDDFPAAHRIRIDADGTLEPVHVHHWRVDVCARCPEPVEPRAQELLRAVQTWVERYRGRSMHRIPPFDHVNPTAEETACVLHGVLVENVAGVEIVRVTIGEAAGFSAAYQPPGADTSPFSGWT